MHDRIGGEVRARSALFTLFGDVVRPAGGQAWLTTLTGCMQTLGFTAEATRTALHRMAGEGWVAPSRSGRFAAYRLTPRGLDRLEEAAARIYRLRAAPWDGRWRLLVAPGVGRDTATGRSLRWMGFGRLSPDVWVSPHPHGDRLRRVLQEAGLSPDTVGFVANGAGGAEQDEQVVASAWDLARLRQAHSLFIDRWAGFAAPVEAREAFPARIRLVHEWRAFLFLDPGLPAPLLPADWLGSDAAQVFRELYEGLERPAWRFYDELVATAPPLPVADSAGPGVGNGSAIRQASPFARGLDAMATDRQSPDPPALQLQEMTS